MKMLTAPPPRVASYLPNKFQLPATFAEARCGASLVRIKVGGVCEKHLLRARIPNLKVSSW
jgi:hypothetical protein